MSTITFDTLSYTKNLEKAGFSREQAEALASEQAKLVEDELVTKHDLKKLEVALKRDIHELELRLTHTLTLRMGGMIIAGVAFLAAIKYFG